ncbi:MAG: hypothetical protein SWN10_12375 [Pseudomonadota bacterium]|jgi:hypothetical protein|nr:hypothetical protein [Pseudomonadota bacterium]
MPNGGVGPEELDGGVGQALSEDAKGKFFSKLNLDLNFPLMSFVISEFEIETVGP